MNIIAIEETEQSISIKDNKSNRMTLLASMKSENTCHISDINGGECGNGIGTSLVYCLLTHLAKKYDDSLIITRTSIEHDFDDTIKKKWERLRFWSNFGLGDSATDIEEYFKNYNDSEEFNNNDSEEFNNNDSEEFNSISKEIEEYFKDYHASEEFNSISNKLDLSNKPSFSKVTLAICLKKVNAKTEDKTKDKWVFNDTYTLNGDPYVLP